MHWELHPTERPAHPQIPWFWVLEKEVYPQLKHISTVPDLIPELRKLPNETVDSMFKVSRTEALQDLLGS